MNPENRFTIEDVLEDQEFNDCLTQIAELVAAESVCLDLTPTLNALRRAIARGISGKEPDPALFSYNSFHTPTLCYRLLLDYEDASRIAKRHSPKADKIVDGLRNWLTDAGCIPHQVKHLEQFAGIEVLYTPVLDARFRYPMQTPGIGNTPKDPQ